MKIFKLTLFLFVLCLFGTSCSKDEETKTSPILESFKRDFPNAENVSWSKKNGYEVASFTLAATRAAAPQQNKAWYSSNNAKCTFTKLELTWSQLQTEAPKVAEAWEASTYKQEGYVIDDIKKKEYKDGVEATYKIEAELGDIEYELTYKLDGTLISAKLDNDADDEDDEDEPAPLQLLEYVAKNLPEAQIIDSETETENNVTYYEIEILYPRGDKNIEYTMIFNDKFALSYISEEIDEDDYQNTEILPTAVYNKVIELAEGKEIDEICMAYKSIEDFKKLTNGKFMAIIEFEDKDGNDVEEIFFLDSNGNVVTL